MTRQPMPDRRASWRQRAVIDSHTFYLTFGEYADGRVGEIFIGAAKEGTFIRGVLDALARTASLALQCGAEVEDVAKSLQLKFPPSGLVQADGSEIKECKSVTDWVASELLNAYGRKKIDSGTIAEGTNPGRS